jgi:predicted RNA binding protein YcfA (HicA-like mRNA interferase family)
MTNIPSLTPKEVGKILKQKRFILDRSHGSHQLWLHPVSHKRAIVPLRNKDIPKGTLFAILKQACLDKADL